MALGSPTGSPSTGSGYLPSYLMGEPNVMAAPRGNTFSPTKGRSLAFGGKCSRNWILNDSNTPDLHSLCSFYSASSPTSPISSNSEFNRSVLQQRALFGAGNQPTSPSQNYANVSQITHTPSVAGPPTQSLFDSLRAEQSTVADQSFSQKSLAQRQLNQSIAMNQSICDSYLNQSNFNASRWAVHLIRHYFLYKWKIHWHRITSPIDQSFDYRNTSISTNCLSPTSSRPSNYWITVYGFSPAATSMILSHFAQCGTILDKVYPPQSGNWVHLRFASSLECDKALNYHERILANSIMIGVTYCKDLTIIDKENLERNKYGLGNLPFFSFWKCLTKIQLNSFHSISISRPRPLAQVAYKTARSANDITGTPTTPIRSSGIVNKAIDLFFGWWFSNSSNITKKGEN